MRMKYSYFTAKENSNRAPNLIAIIGYVVVAPKRIRNSVRRKLSSQTRPIYDYKIKTGFSLISRVQPNRNVRSKL